MMMMMMMMVVVVVIISKVQLTYFFEFSDFSDQCLANITAT